MKTISVMIVGVGGQGSLLASRLLGTLLTDEGFDVKVSEVHGMSQRGGSVVTYVRYGDKVYSPIVTEGECDYIISFEKLEAARYASCLKKGGRMIVNTQQIDPMPVITGAAAYPENVLEEMKANGFHVDDFDALAPALEAGSAKAVNIVLMGYFAACSGFEKEKWLSALEKTVKPKFLEMNKKAFELGYAGQTSRTA
ncbi:MAG: indolepyruvate oxidoreductase subunit beta [Clostridiales bacterium]|nr:indolepyruvate oxidoreductase subunit beta [Clostridiales bacterium]